MRGVQKSNKLTLRSIRTKLGLTQKQLAEQLDVRRETVSDWERGKFAPSLSISQIKTLENLLSAVGLTFQDLPDDLSSN